MGFDAASTRGLRRGLFIGDAGGGVFAPRGVPGLLLISLSPRGLASATMLLICSLAWSRSTRGEGSGDDWGAEDSPRGVVALDEARELAFD